MRRPLLGALLVFWVCPGTAPAQSLEELVPAYRKKPTAAARQSLERYARAHRADESGALALLVLGSKQAADDPAEAIPKLREAMGRLPRLGDYVSYHLARALYETGDYARAITELERTMSSDPPSPLETRTVLLAAQVYLDSGDAAEGVKLLREYRSVLPQPDGLLMLARSQESTGARAAAAATYQRVYYEFPITSASRQADAALSRLRRRLGTSYPPVPAQLMFTRVERLIRNRKHLIARKELQQMTTTLGGADRDHARVWLGKARYIRKHDSTAYRWLKSLKVSDPDADAERLYYLLASARRLNRRGDVRRVIEELERWHPDSNWRALALVSAGNMYLLENDPEHYVPLYRTCAEAFPAHRRAAYCDWKVAWSYYIRRKPEAAELFRAHLSDFPGSEKASAALYFLGRLAEDAGNRSAAATYFREVEHEYPNYYYAYLARGRLAQTGSAANGGADEVRSFLDGIEFPRRRHQKNFDPTPLTSARLGRARLLFSAGLRDWGESELRYGARTGAQGPILAVELAASAGKAGDYGRSIRYIKGLAPGYLSMPLEDAPESFWRLTFPLPYRDILKKYSARRKIGLYFLAALIRQESEFDRRAVSRARAYGLTQVLPSTGRQLSRKLGIRRFRTSMLYQPDINVNMGTYFLRGLIDELEGHTEAALAAYNAGRSRARNWLRWADFREPAEFVETVPFSETRTYIQTVLRNAEIYRRLYGSPPQGPR